MLDVKEDEQFTIKPLEDKWRCLLVDSWKFSDEMTDHMIGTLIRLNRVFGAYDCQGGSAPVGWMMIYRFSTSISLDVFKCIFSDGSIGMLKVHEDYQRRGLGRLLVYRMVEEAVKIGLIPFVHIEDDNEVSKAFFRRLGFREGDTAIWINHVP